jgi:phage tail sheath gpL-like
MTFNFTELAATPSIPFTGIETDFNVGGVVDPTSAKALLVMGYQTSAGSANINEVTQPSSLSDVIEKHGIGSQLALMWEAAANVFRRLPIFCLPYPEGTGTATGTVTVTDGGGNATAAGAIEVVIAGRVFRAGYGVGDTVTEIATAIVAEINGHYNLPATAGNVAGVATLTARNLGLSGNTIRYRASVTPNTGISVATAGATFTGGTAEGNPTTALANIEQLRFHNNAINSPDAVNAALVMTHIKDKSNAFNKKWGNVTFPMVGTRSAGETLINATINDKRGNVPWLYGAEQPEFEVAAYVAALKAFVVRRNDFLLDREVPGLIAPHDKTLWPTETELDAAVKNGLSPLRPRDDGTVELVRNVLAVTPPPPFVDQEKLEISDWLDELYITRVDTLRRKKTALKTRSIPGTPNVLTPKEIQEEIHDASLFADETLDYIQGVRQAIADGKYIVKPSATAEGRVDAGFPFTPVDPALNVSMLKTLERAITL